MPKVTWNVVGVGLCGYMCVYVRESPRGILKQFIRCVLFIIANPESLPQPGTAKMAGLSSQRTESWFLIAAVISGSKI